MVGESNGRLVNVLLLLRGAISNENGARLSQLELPRWRMSAAATGAKTARCSREV
jgi:hypothetical protein